MENEDKNETQNEIEAENKQTIKMKDSSSNDDELFKKFIVRVDNENLRLIDELSYSERNVFINNLLRNYTSEEASEEKAQMKSMWKKAIIVFLILFGLPIFISLVNLSLKLTASSYSIFQDNFQQLFDSRRK